MRVAACRVPEEGTEEAVRLMDDCMHLNPSMRPDAKAVVTRLMQM